MRKTVKKTFWIWQLEKEEEWLNQMAAEGWCLISVGYRRYEFEQVPPGLFTIRTEWLEKSANHSDSFAYIEFLKSTGAVNICNRGNMAYFRKIADNNFQLYSDNSSRIKYYSRLIKYFGTLVFLYSLIIVMRWLLFFVKLFVDNGFDWFDFLFAIFWTALTIPFAFGLSKYIKKRKALKEEQNLYE